MKYTQSVGEKSTVKLTIDFSEEEWKDAVSKAYVKTVSSTPLTMPTKRRV